MFRPRELSDEDDGAALVLPLKDPRNLKVPYGIMGTIAIDTLPTGGGTTLERDQIKFFQVHPSSVEGPSDAERCLLRLFWHDLLQTHSPTPLCL